MTDPLVRDALRQIQDLVVETKGSPLSREAVRRLEAVLKRMTAQDASSPVDAKYSEREVTILFADLRGFSAIAATYPPDVVLPVLSGCFAPMTEIAVRHYGTIDKFVGDAIMVVFHRESAPPRDHARRALLCAVEMQLAMNELRAQYRKAGLPELYLGIGISTGNVMAGLIGSDAYRAYTVIGEHVNLAARIEALSLRGQVLISEATYQHCAGFVQAGAPMDVHVKGKSENVRIREVLAIPELGKAIPRQDQRKSPRVKVELDLEYQPVAAKIVASKTLHAQILDLSYHGALVEMAERPALYSELKLAFDLPGLHFRAGDIYARVVSARDQGDWHLAGLEFTSLGAETSNKIQLFVQMRLQGE
jgi:adenylate cyclase